MLALFDPLRQDWLPTRLDEGAHLNSAFGLVFHTPFPCPELYPCGPAPADVRVTYRAVEPVSRPSFNGSYNQIEFGGGSFLHNKTGVVRTLSLDGREVHMQRMPFVHDDEVRYVFLTIVMTAILLQRGILPMHASAVHTPRGAFLFVGRSGAGKSTLAAELLRRGYLLQGDDITPIEVPVDGPPLAVPGFPQLKLCLDAAAHLDQAVRDTPRVRPKEEKLSVLRHDSFRREPSPLRAIVRLEPADVEEVEIRSLKGLEKLNALIEFTFNQSFLDGLGRRAAHFKQITTVGNAVDLYAVRRPRAGYRLRELADRLEAELFT